MFRFRFALALMPAVAGAGRGTSVGARSFIASSARAAAAIATTATTTYSITASLTATAGSTAGVAPHSTAAAPAACVTTGAAGLSQFLIEIHSTSRQWYCCTCGKHDGTDY